MRSNKYFHCANGLLMPDGSGFCCITMSLCSGCDISFEPGEAKSYKPLPREKVAKQKVVKVKVKEAKPIPVTKSIKKTSTEQRRLF